MTPTDFRDAVRLLDAALVLLSRHHRREPRDPHRWRVLVREMALLRARLGQPAAELRRN